MAKVNKKSNTTKYKQRKVFLFNVSYLPTVNGSSTNLDEFKTARAESPTPNRAVRKGCYSVDA